MYYVYVLHSSKDKGLYVGFSGNLRRRYHEHEIGAVQSTTGRRPLLLIYYEAYLSLRDAESREVFLKSGAGRKFLDKQLKVYFEANPRRPAT